MWVVDSPSATLWSPGENKCWLSPPDGCLRPPEAAQPAKNTLIFNSLQCRCTLLKAKIQLFLSVYVEINGNDEDDIIIGATEASYSQRTSICAKKLHFVMKTGAWKDRSI